MKFLIKLVVTAAAVWVATLLIPGILAAAVLVLVRTVGMFELTFLAAGPSSGSSLRRPDGGSRWALLLFYRLVACLAGR